MRSFGIALAAITSSLVAACFPVPAAPPVPRTAMAVAAPFAQTWEAAIDALAERNIQIKTVDRASGLIVAEPQPVSSDNAEQLADCGLTAGQMIKLPTAATWNLLVRGDSVRSTVKANARFVYLSSSRGLMTSAQNQTPEECSTKGVWETELESQLKKAAEAKPR